MVQCYNTVSDSIQYSRTVTVHVQAVTALQGYSREQYVNCLSIFLSEGPDGKGYCEAAQVWLHSLLSFPHLHPMYKGMDN